MDNNIAAVADTITESAKLVIVGALPVLVRPLTLAQIYEIGALVENAEGLDLDGEINPVATMLSEYRNVELCAAVVNVILFRKRWKRFVFGRYVKKRLTMAKYKEIIEYAATAFGAAFFLTSFTFLKGTREVTKRTNTGEATAHGDSSEE